MKNLTRLFLLTATVVTLNSCGSAGEDKKNDSGATIAIDGSSTVYPLTEAVAEEYKNEAGNVRITIGLSGTGGGFKKFGRGEIDINNASRPIKESEETACKEHGISFTGLKVAYDGLAVVVSKENTWCRDITVAELKKLWEPEAQGKIKRWSQVRAGWPDEEIHLFGPGVESGTYDYFTEVIVGKSHSSRGDFTASEDDNVLVQGIKSDKNAMGFFGLAYFTENQDKLQLVAVDDGNPDNGAGPVLPSEQTVKNKSYVPLGRPLFMYVSNKAAQRKEVADFVSFYIASVKSLAPAVGYISLNDEEIAAEQQKLSDFVESLK